MSALKKQRLQADTEKERAARLVHMSALHQKGLEAETEEERAARLEHMSALKRRRLASESQEEREREREREKRLPQNGMTNAINTATPLVEHKGAKHRVLAFHKELLSINTIRYSAFLKTFPGTKTSAKSTECQKCLRDKKTKKLYCLLD